MRLDGQAVALEALGGRDPRRRRAAAAAAVAAGQVRVVQLDQLGEARARVRRARGGLEDLVGRRRARRAGGRGPAVVAGQRCVAVGPREVLGGGSAGCEGASQHRAGRSILGQWAAAGCGFRGSCDGLEERRRHLPG